MKTIVIQDQIFENYPDFYRGLIIVRNINNQTPHDAIYQLMKKQIEERQTLDLAEEARLISWNNAHKKFGSKPGKYLPSIKSLLKRVQKTAELPYINSVVALFNYISLKYCLPCGGDDIANIKGDLVLGYADGNEPFQALGSDKMENPKPGEVIYFDSETQNVMCRRWNWRNGSHTKIEESSKQIVINLDCLPPITQKTGIEARDELAELLKAYCEADLELGALHSGSREFQL